MSATNCPVILPKFRLPRKFMDLLHAANLRHGTDSFTFPSEGRRAEDFFRPKNPKASAGFEPANLGTKGQHATHRPPKPMYFMYMYLLYFMYSLTCNISWNSKIMQIFSPECNAVSSFTSLKTLHSHHCTADIYWSEGIQRDVTLLKQTSLNISN